MTQLGRAAASSSIIDHVCFASFYVFCFNCYFCDEDEKINTRAERPRSRPARLPMAQTAFEIMNIDFFEFDKHVILHMQDVFTRFSILKYMGEKKVHAKKRS